MGWYLMLVDSGAPALRIFPDPWSTIQHSFDTAKECEDARAKAVLPPQPATVEVSPSRLAFFCIASDDPRLKP